MDQFGYRDQSPGVSYNPPDPTHLRPVVNIRETNNVEDPGKPETLFETLTPLTYRTKTGDETHLE